MWEKERLAVFVTLLPSLNVAEWYVVRGSGLDASELLSDGACKLSKLSSELSAAFTEAFGQRAAD